MKHRIQLFPTSCGRQRTVSDWLRTFVRGHMVSALLAGCLVAALAGPVSAATLGSIGLDNVTAVNTNAKNGTGAAEAFAGNIIGNGSRAISTLRLNGSAISGIDPGYNRVGVSVLEFVGFFESTTASVAVAQTARFNLYAYLTAPSADPAAAFDQTVRGNVPYTDGVILNVLPSSVTQLGTTGPGGIWNTYKFTIDLAALGYGDALATQLSLPFSPELGDYLYSNGVSLSNSGEVGAGGAFRISFTGQLPSANTSQFGAVTDLEDWTHAYVSPGGQNDLIAAPNTTHNYAFRQDVLIGIVPEPGVAGLLALGGLAVGLRRRRSGHLLPPPHASQ